jgi:hypothetical protein
MSKAGISEEEDPIVSKFKAEDIDEPSVKPKEESK